MNKMVSLFLMGRKGLAVLDALITAGYQQMIEVVVLAKDKNVENDYFEPLQELCDKNGIPYADKKDITATTSSFLIAVSWRWMIQTTASQQLIVLHDSLLPRYRGFAPLVNALINGEKQTGVTALFATKEYDKGDIIFQEKIDIYYPAKIQEIIEKISFLYAGIVCKIFHLLKNNQPISPLPQNENEATYSLWRSDADYQINWAESAEYIKRFIDAVGYPYLGASTKVAGEIYHIINAETYADVKIEIRDVGKVIFIRDGYPVVVCGKGLLKITEMINSVTGHSALPLKNFRTRFL